ncbi:MAG: 3'-5' exonuclease, partial [Allomuricauda sp.]
LSLTAPDGVDAIKIMTIHKAKGLEFPIVIFPFANMSINGTGPRKKAWVDQTEMEKDWGMDEFLINRNKDMQHYNKLAAKTFADETDKTELDVFNVLYVALTRAEKGLYVISENSKGVTSLESATSYSDLFQYYLENQKVQPSSPDKYVFGELMENAAQLEKATPKNESIPYITRPKGKKQFAISTKSSGLWDDEKRTAIETGNLIHYALSLIEVAEDISAVIENLNSLGHLHQNNIDNVYRTLNDVVTHPNLKKYYSDDYRVLNEQEILTPEGVSYRPDRLMIYADEVTIIDYKTGKPAPSHREQILTYAQILQAMDFTVKDTIIVYIGPEIKPLFL